MLRSEQGLMWQAHPRAKGSAGYPDAVRDKPHFLGDRFLGGSYQSLPVDQSEQRLCESRCLGLLDEMNNWTSAKYMIAEGDTYQKFPDDETYPQLIVNYVKLDRVPKFDEDWSPILRAMRAGDFFVSTSLRRCRSGRYSVTVEAAGFKKSLRSEITVNVLFVVRPAAWTLRAQRSTTSSHCSIASSDAALIPSLVRGAVVEQVRDSPTRVLESPPELPQYTTGSSCSPLGICNRTSLLGPKRSGM